MAAVAREYEQISLEENSELEDEHFSSYNTKRTASQSESDLNVSASESGTDVTESYLTDDGPTTLSTSSTTAGGSGSRARCLSAMTSAEGALIERGSPSSRRQGFNLAGYTGHPYFNSLDSNGSPDEFGGTGIEKTDARTRRDSNMIEGLLCEIYDRVHVTPHNYKVDSDGFTECSSNSDGAYLSSKGDSFRESSRLPKAHLISKGTAELQEMVRDLQHGVALLNGRLVKLLKRRDRNLAKQTKNQDVLTAILQAVSQKRRVDARLKFSIEPLPGKKAFRQWYDALRAVARLPAGIPPAMRKKFWLSLANRHVQHLKLDWTKTVRFAFNDRSNPDDDKLGVQIVKDLHRTGCTGFCGTDAEGDRVVLKRVLLAYARWNKSVGYCQGFNVLAALILEVVEHVEDEALKVMIFLIDHVLPDSYFANNLRALSVDMAVFRELLHFKLPDLAQHLDRLQKAANDGVSGNYEPPLTNVFTMQWFLTLFATCLPKPLVLRVWDCIFLEGSEVLLRVALAIWAKLGSNLAEVDSSDEFYGRMGALCNEMLTKNLVDGDELIQTIYSMAVFPFPHLNEIREKYMFSITPFSPIGSLDESNSSEGLSPKRNKVKSSSQERPPSDDDNDMDEMDGSALACFTGLLPTPMSPTRGKSITQGDRSAKSRTNTGGDITGVSPGAFASNSDTDSQQKPQTAMMERMNIDVYALKKQYWRVQRRQQSAHVIYGAAGTKEESRGRRLRHHSRVLAAPIDNPAAINHLLIGKHGLGKKSKKTAIMAPQVSANSKRKNRSPSTSTMTGSPPRSLPSSVPSRGSPDTMSLMSSGGSSIDPANLEQMDNVVVGGAGQADMIEGIIEGNVYHCDDIDSDGIGERPEVTDGSYDNGTTEDERTETSTEDEHTPTEPTVGLLIDVGDSAISFLAKHMGPSDGDRQISPLNTGSQGGGANGSSFVKNRENNLATPPPAQLNVSLESSESNKSTPRGSLSSLDFDNNLVAKDDVSEATKREFNMSVNAYTPELPIAATMEGMSTNPKMEGQSNRKPWQTWESDDSDDFWDIDDDDDSATSQRSESASHQKYHQRQKSPQAKPATFNPFPRRKLKSEEDRTRNRLKVGLYKVPAGKKRQSDHPVQRMVKLGW